MKDQFKGIGIIAKLNYIQTHLHVPKDCEVKNTFGKTQYCYRNLDTILEKVKPLLEDTGCTLHIDEDAPIVVGSDITPIFDEEKDKYGNIVRHMIVGPHFYTRAHCILKDIEDGKFVEAAANSRETEWRKGMDASQLSGSTSSYAGKYAAQHLLGLDDSEDSDALAAKDAKETTPAPAKPKPSETATRVTNNGPEYCPFGSVPTKWESMPADRLEKALACSDPHITDAHREVIRRVLAARKQKELQDI